ncbi:hypothetical protein Halha_1957 [Halobacteroides halobius DSM 5150]|uniref:Bacteriocin-type signal sequence n=1 Tax=Halobacteroides halobius (strain ATCC 35273 / DSM 5150 / MD-1) TaxID=748449 RepID=L0K9B1_HALHC|nr:bacteriocin [Halobacteroides halobius]AGB41862.1 hypothetical protein Halha_1957 [Halobacteroides halobius DSM 5150]
MESLANVEMNELSEKELMTVDGGFDGDSYGDFVESCGKVVGRGLEAVVDEANESAREDFESGTWSSRSM